MTIGVFDSGSGGRFVAEKLQLLLPDFTYTVINDLAHAPYGERSYDDICRLTEAAIQPLLDSCDIIILACNTATAAAISHLRETYPDKTFVGFEPMIKPATGHSATRHITLLATKATAYSPRTESLIKTYGNGCTIDRPPTFGWAKAIDAGLADSISLEDIATSIASGSDTIIIGCTHYIALIPRLSERFPGVAILEPTEAVARQIIKLIEN